MITNLETATNYALNCISGLIPACSFVKQAAERFLSDIESKKYHYSATEVDRVIRFINKIDLTEQTTPKKFLLEDWQTFIVANIYGIIRNDNNKRKYRFAYIELARKNGKSQLVTALAMYHLLTDVDAQVIVSANSKDQVKNVDFKKILQFASQLDRKQKHLIPYYNSLKYGKTSELIVTASDAKKLDGLNVSFSLIDELHEAPDNSMYNVMKSSQGGRAEPLLMTITTAGFNQESFCYQQRSYCADILSGMKTDETQFAIIYTLDDDDDFENPENWKKANPNLNVSIYSDFLESEVNKAVNNSAEKSSVLVKNFNRWLRNNTLETWIPEEFVNAVMCDIKITDEMFKDRECIVGVDLASVSDITAVCYLFDVDGTYYFFLEYYLPEDSVNSNANVLFFKEAGARGEINITDGNVCDYDYILKDMLKVNENTPIKKIYYDKFNSTQFIIDATEACLQCAPFSQTAGALNKPLKEFERLLKSEKIAIQKNSVTKWMIANVVLDVNKMGNFSIDKRSKSKKIDGVAAMIDALGGMLEAPVCNFDIL